MSSEIELQRLIVRLMGDGTAYQKMLEQAVTVTDQLGQEMKRLGGTEAEFTAITARAAAVTNTATDALGRHNWEQRRLQGLLDAGRISEQSYERQVAKTGSVLESATSSLNKHAEAVARGLAITRATETPLESYKRKIAELDKLIAADAITQQAYNRVGEQLNNQLPRTIALKQQEAIAVRAAAQAHREAERATTRANAQAQKDFISSQRQLSAAIREGAMIEQAMNRKDQAAQLRTARYAAIAQADAERELARVRKQGAAVTKEMMTAQEQYAARLSHLNTLLRQSAISQQVHGLAVTAAQKAMRESLVVVNTLGKDISRAGLSLRGFGTSWSIFVTAPLTAFLGASTMAGVKMDSLTRGLTAITHSSANTKKQLEDMLEVAKLPGLGFKEAVEGHIRLQATGFAANTSKRALLAFGNALATVGKGKADLDGVVLALTQISAKGKVMAQEINQLGERVPQIRKIMEQAFGTADTEKIQQMGLSSREFIEMIVTELEKLPKVTGGALNDLENLSDAAFIAFSKVGESILEILVPAVKSATNLITDLGDWFIALPGPVRVATVAIIAVVAAIGPIAVVAGQATIAIGGLITAYTALSATAAGTVALFGTLLVGSIIGIIAVTGLLIYEVTGARAAYQNLNEQIRESKRLTDELSGMLDTHQRKIIQVAEAMEGADKKEFLRSQLDAAKKNLAGIEQHMTMAKDELESYHQTWTGGASTLSKWTGAHQTASTAVAETTKQFKEQNARVEELEKLLAGVDYPDQLDTIRQQTILNKEADNYIKSLERKIETLARGEAATKVASFVDRQVDNKKIERMNELIAKEEELKTVKAAKTESDKLKKDIEDLTAKLNAQIEAFGGVKYATDIQSLANRDVASAFREELTAAEDLSKKLDELKVADKVAEDAQKLTDKLTAEIAELKSGAESSELFALKQRGIGLMTEFAIAALEAEKKSLKEAADLQKDIKTFTENLQSQVATFGMASEEADLYKFALRGATTEQLAQARALTTQKTALEENKKLMEAAKKVNEKFEPKTKFVNEYAELNKMLKAGAISTETFQKATQDLQKDLLEAQEKADVQVRFTVEGNEAVRAGSAEFIKMLSEVEQRAKDVQITSALQKDIESLQKDLITGTPIPKPPEMTDELARGIFAGDDMFTPSLAPPEMPSLLAGLEGLEPYASGTAAEESEVTLDDTAIAIFNAMLEAIRDGNDAPGVVINNIGG